MLVVIIAAVIGVISNSSKQEIAVNVGILLGFSVGFLLQGLPAGASWRCIFESITDIQIRIIR